MDTTRKNSFITKIRCNHLSFPLCVPKDSEIKTALAAQMYNTNAACFCTVNKKK